MRPPRVLAIVNHMRSDEGLTMVWVVSVEGCVRGRCSVQRQYRGRAKVHSSNIDREIDAALHRPNSPSYNFTRSIEGRAVPASTCDAAHVHACLSIDTRCHRARSQRVNSISIPSNRPHQLRVDEFPSSLSLPGASPAHSQRVR